MRPKIRFFIILLTSISAQVSSVDEIMANNTISVSVTIPKEYLKAHHIHVEKVGNHFVLQHERDRHRLAPLELFTQWENGPYQVLDYKVFNDEAAQAQNEDRRDMVRGSQRGFQWPQPSSIFDTALAEMMNPGSNFQSTVNEGWEKQSRNHKEAMERLHRQQELQRQQHDSEMEKLLQGIRRF